MNLNLSGVLFSLKQWLILFLAVKFHLLFHYSRFSPAIVRNLFLCNNVNNSFRKWEKPLLCYVVKWNLVSTLTYFANPPCSWSPSAQIFFISQESLVIVTKLFPSGQNFGRNILTLKWSLMRLTSIGNIFFQSFAKKAKISYY